MFNNRTARYVLPAFIVVALALLACWFFYNPVHDFTVSVPGMDNRKKGGNASREAVKIGTEFKFFKAAEDLPGTNWPRFRGEDYDNVCKEKIRLIDHCASQGAKQCAKENPGGVKVSVVIGVFTIVVPLG